MRDGLVATLPQPKPRRALPTRTTTMLIARDADGRVLLERRPPTGVWARLWSLPEVEHESLAQTSLLLRHGVRASTAQRLDPFVHTFSHYHLDVTPLLLADAVGDAHVADDPDAAWRAPAELASLGLPAPVRKLLQSLEEHE